MKQNYSTSLKKIFIIKDIDHTQEDNKIIQIKNPYTQIYYKFINNKHYTYNKII